jgi:drug/metabolite transporter (DMT)-like permease
MYITPLKQHTRKSAFKAMRQWFLSSVISIAIAALLFICGKQFMEAAGGALCAGFVCFFVGVLHALAGLFKKNNHEK